MGSLLPETYQQMITLLKDPMFVRLHRLSSKHPLTWVEFRELRMPQGITCEQAWSILNAIRRQTATELPFRDGAGRRGWFQTTRSIIVGQEDVEKRCHAGSHLDMITASRNMMHTMPEVYINEMISYLREDGMDIEYEAAREILLSERSPEEPEELLLANSYRAMQNLSQYVDEPCTPELLQDMHARISEGIEVETMTVSRRNSLVWKAKELDSLSTLELISRLINETRAEDIEHPLILALGIRYLLVSSVPFRAWNSLASALFMRFLFLKSDLPVLARIPMSGIVCEWERGQYFGSSDIPTIDEAEVLIDDEVDYTMYVDIVFRFVRKELDKVEERLKRIVEKDEAFMQTLRGDLDINHRQRSVLQVALSDPKTVFKISDHQKQFMLSYGTARSDLLGLAERGLLQRTKEGHAFAFRATHGLRQLIMVRDRKGGSLK